MTGSASGVIVVEPPVKKRAKRACLNCRSSKVACDQQRPCTRCTKHGIEETCLDIPRKPKVVGKRQKKDANSSPSSALAQTGTTEPILLATSASPVIPASSQPEIIGMPPLNIQTMSSPSRPSKKPKHTLTKSAYPSGSGSNQDITSLSCITNTTTSPTIASIPSSPTSAFSTPSPTLSSYSSDSSPTSPHSHFDLSNLQNNQQQQQQQDVSNNTNSLMQHDSPPLIDEIQQAPISTAGIQSAFENVVSNLQSLINTSSNFQDPITLGNSAFGYCMKNHHIFSSISLRVPSPLRARPKESNHPWNSLVALFRVKTSTPTSRWGFPDRNLIDISDTFCHMLGYDNVQDLRSTISTPVIWDDIVHFQIIPFTNRYAMEAVIKGIRRFQRPCLFKKKQGTFISATILVDFDASFTTYRITILQKLTEFYEEISSEYLTRELRAKNACLELDDIDCL
eukprot:gene12600-14786_t